LYHNPAATGISDKFMASATYRSQWAGSPSLSRHDRPSYILFNAAQYLADQRSGVGLTIYNATQHVQHILQAKVSYAYHLQVMDEAWLAMGINVGFLSKGIRDGMTVEGQPWNESHAMSDLGLGLEYYTPELQVGFAAQHIPAIIGSSEERQHTHFYYYATYFHTINEEWRVIPSVVIRNSSFITNYDISARISYLNMFQFGFSWRRDAVAFLLGFSFEDTYSIGYSFDIHTGTLLGARPSHEIVLNYRTQLFNKEDTRLQRLNISHDF
jgi:type IX secretion system PorP/SprF family membrane protein